MSIIEIDHNEPDYVPGGGGDYLGAGDYEIKLQVESAQLKRVNTKDGEKQLIEVLCHVHGGEEDGKQVKFTYWLTDKSKKYFTTFCKWFGVKKLNTTKIDETFKGKVFEANFAVKERGGYHEGTLKHASLVGAGESKDDDFPF